MTANPSLRQPHDEELDFIISYDIKYRMGRSAGESDAKE